MTNLLDFSVELGPDIRESLLQLLLEFSVRNLQCFQPRTQHLKVLVSHLFFNLLELILVNTLSPFRFEQIH